MPQSPQPGELARLTDLRWGRSTAARSPSSTSRPNAPWSLGSDAPLAAGPAMAHANPMRPVCSSTLVLIVAALVGACGGAAAPPASSTAAPPGAGDTSPVTSTVAPPAPSTPPPGAAGRCEGPLPGRGYQCMQQCGPPVARVGDPPPPYRWFSPEDLEKRNKYGCPRCLPANARIATPRGYVDVADLRVGDVVWSKDARGRRVAQRLVEVRATPVASGHQMTVVTLDDGRRVVASPSHPIVGGSSLGRLRSGHQLDGSTVVEIRGIAYRGASTYDILPEGDTSQYWADGVLLASTLRHE